jgi:hypothetical protein
LVSEKVSGVTGLAEGALIAGYRIERRIGAGGMAVVYRAYDARLNRLVALKVMAPAAASDDAFRRRFILESQAAAAVDDPHIIPVYEAGEADGTLFIAMRYVAGGDVHSLVRQAGPLPPDRAMSIISPIASALDAAHAAGLVHRDVKPANMLLDVRPGRPDHVYLSDFGLSKGALASHGLTAAGQFLGTPDYTAPEQMRALPTDGRADQYALACSVFALLTGAPPFPREQVTAVIWAQMSDPPPLLATRRPGLPAAADAVLGRALAKHPASRYATCREFAEALRSALGLAPYHSGPGTIRSQAAPAVSPVSPVSAVSPGRHSAPASPRPGRRAVLLGGAAAVAVAAAGGGAWALAGRRGPATASGRSAGQHRALSTLPGRTGAGNTGASRTGAGAPAPGSPGSVIWTTALSSALAPWLHLVAGPGVIYLRAQYGIAALGMPAGGQLWSITEHGDNRLVYSIAASQDAVYVSAGSGSQYDVSALTPARGVPQWSAPLLAPGLAAADGLVFAAGEQDGLPGLFALDPASGRQLWRYSATVIGTPAVTGGVVYALASVNASYQLYAVVAASGRPLWTQPADWSDSPVVADGDTVCIVGQSSGALWVWAAGTGKLLWTSDADGGIVSAAVAAGIVYAITKNGSLLALEAASNKLLWQKAANIVISPTISGGTVYAGSPGYGIIARQSGDGSELWQSEPGIVTSGPAVADGIVYVAGEDTVYALRA